MGSENGRWRIGRGPTDKTFGRTTVVDGDGREVAEFFRREDAEAACEWWCPSEITLALVAICNEHARATALHGRFNSAHEGYAVLLEEIDEMWDEIKANAPAHARKEAIQVGAMVLRMLTEVLPG